MTGWTLVQESATQAQGSSGTLTPTLPAGSTAGTLLVAFLSSNTATAFTLPSNWVTGIAVTNGTGNQQQIAWLPPAFNAGGITSEVFLTGAGNNPRASLAEFALPTGMNTVAADVTGFNTGGAVTSIAVSTAAAKAGDLGVCCFAEHLAAAATVTWTTPSGWTTLTGSAVGSTVNQYAAFEVLAGGTVSVTGTSGTTASASSGWTGAVITFTASAAATQHSGLVSAFY
jgi:hypothetical protein